MKFLIALLAAAVTVSASPAKEKSVSVCPALNNAFASFVAHPTDCTKFYECSWGNPVLMECPKGLYFNPTLDVCDEPETSGCVQPDTRAVSACPSQNGEFASFVAHATDCTKYYECNWGNPILMDCPVGTYFNPTLDICDFPEKSGCVQKA